MPVVENQRLTSKSPYKVVARMIGAPLASSPQIVPINRSRGGLSL